MTHEPRVVRRWLMMSAILPLALLAGLAGTALGATTTSASFMVGPVPLSNPAPVSACVNQTCVSTPELSAMTLKVEAKTTTDALISAPPVIAPASCPDGQQGVAVTITAPQTGTATVTATVSGTLPDGKSRSKTTGPVTIPAASGSSTTVSACTTVLA